MLLRSPLRFQSEYFVTIRDGNCLKLRRDRFGGSPVGQSLASTSAGPGRSCRKPVARAVNENPVEVGMMNNIGKVRSIRQYGRVHLLSDVQNVAEVIRQAFIICFMIR